MCSLERSAYTPILAGDAVAAVEILQLAQVTFPIAPHTVTGLPVRSSAILHRESRIALPFPTPSPEEGADSGERGRPLHTVLGKACLDADQAPLRFHAYNPDGAHRQSFRAYI